MINCRAYGDPKGQPRIRRSRHGGVYTPATADGWRTMVALAIRQQNLTSPMEGPVRMAVEFVFKRPKSHSNKSGIKTTAPMWHTSRPDIDNLIKLVMDVCTEMEVYADDTQVVRLETVKRYANDEKPGASIRIEINQCHR